MESKIVRERIRFLIAREPGIRFQELRRCLGTSESNLRYHVKWLEKNDEIRIDREHGEKRIFPSGSMESDREKSGDTRLEKRLLTLIEAHPGIEKDDLADRIYITRKKLRGALKKLSKEKRIIAYKNFGRIRYMLSDRYYEWKFRKLVRSLIDGELDEREFLERKEKLDRRCRNPGDM